MSLYHVHYDGEPYYIEAPSFSLAVEVFKAKMKAEDNVIDGQEEPDSVHLLSEDPVIRHKDKGRVNLLEAMAKQVGKVMLARTAPSGSSEGNVKRTFEELDALDKFVDELNRRDGTIPQIKN